MLAIGGKHLLGPGWHSAATTDPDALSRTWCAGDNIGVGCWRSNMLGVDLDVKGAVDGTAACAEHVGPWPDTLACGRT